VFAANRPAAVAPETVAPYVAMLESFAGHGLDRIPPDLANPSNRHPSIIAQPS
jgi:hypothetical protein